MTVDFTLEEFNKHKGNWLLYRSMGKLGENGIFEAPLSYFESQQMPRRELEIFMSLDDLAAKIIKRIAKPGAK